MRLNAKPTYSLTQTMRNYFKVSLLLSKKMGLSEKKMREFSEILRSPTNPLVCRGGGEKVYKYNITNLIAGFFDFCALRAVGEQRAELSRAPRALGGHEERAQRMLCEKWMRSARKPSTEREI